MTLSPETITVPDILALTRLLSVEDRHWLVELLQFGENTPLPETTTLEKAVALYMVDACSLGRAAELAGVTRWDIINYLKERDIVIFANSTRSAEEIDDYAVVLEQAGILAPLHHS